MGFNGIYHLVIVTINYYGNGNNMVNYIYNFYINLKIEMDKYDKLPSGYD
jgi:hypothetical protein